MNSAATRAKPKSGRLQEALVDDGADGHDVGHGRKAGEEEQHAEREDGVLPPPPHASPARLASARPRAPPGPTARSSPAEGFQGQRRSSRLRVWPGWHCAAAEEPVFSFGVLLFFAGLAPVGHIVPIRTIHQRALPVPAALGFALVAAEFISRPSGRRWRLGLASVALLASTALNRPAHERVARRLHSAPGDAQDLPAVGAGALRDGPRLLGQGEWKEARAEIQTALAVRSGVLRGAGAARILKDEKLDEAVAGYRETMQVRIEYAPALFLLGTADLRMGDFDEAARVLEAALKAAPERVDINANLAAAYAGWGGSKKR